MIEFVQRHAEKITGWMSGFDRLWFRGTLRLIASVGGLLSYMRYRGGGGGILHKDFGTWSQGITEAVKEGGRAAMEQAGGKVFYLGRSGASKEDKARQIAAERGIREGPVCLLETLEMGQSYEMHRDREKKLLVLEPRPRLSLHQYSYWMDREVGMCHVRVQSWLPLNVFISMNGREWLCRSLDQAGVRYQRRDNALVWVQDMEKARALLALQLKTPWEALLGRLLGRANPVLAGLLKLDKEPLRRYWSLEQSEWATDILFKQARELEGLYPMWARQAILGAGSVDVMRFLGMRVNKDGRVPERFAREVISDLKLREEGMRVKHRVGNNSVKLYNKQGSVLRTETTIHDPRGLKVYRGTEEAPEDKRWRPVRKGVADLYRVAEIGEKSNQRYLSFLSQVQCEEKLGEVMAPVCRRVQVKGKRYRGLSPMEPADRALLLAVGQGQWSIRGFTNGELRQVLGGAARGDARETQRQRGRMSRQLALLRAHGIIKRVSGTRRWILTRKGRQIVTLTAAANHASAKELMQRAA